MFSTTLLVYRGRKCKRGGVCKLARPSVGQGYAVLEGGLLQRPVMKSIPISSHFHSKIRSDCSSLAGLWCSALILLPLVFCFDSIDDKIW